MPLQYTASAAGGVDCVTVMGPVGTWSKPTKLSPKYPVACVPITVPEALIWYWTPFRCVMQVLVRSSLVALVTSTPAGHSA